MARLSTIKEQKKKNKASKKRIKSIKDVKKAEIPDDLYESGDGTLRQKYDDDGHMSEEWRRILMGEDLRVQRKTKKKNT
tara:strand:- start:48 stop:284 length:237 start_codon:yes stop_codon:yes gene_type:complete